MRAIDQRDRLRRYLRTLKANCSRAYRELSEIERIRNGCAFERNLRYKRLEDAKNLLALAEKCLAELNHCYVLRLAGLRPGTHIVVETTLRGFDPSPRRYLVLDVIWQKGDQYHYLVQRVTMTGAIHRGQYPSDLIPSHRVSIRQCEELLPLETQREADAVRREINELLNAALERGDISMYLPKRESQVQ